jgi:predicted nucleic acid-binding protein
LIYLDSSALVKLILAEAESPSLREWLAQNPDQPMVSSTLHRAEVARAIWRYEPAALPQCYRLMRRVQRLGMSKDLLDTAATVPPQMLRSGDAIHLATALTIKHHLKAFVAYDKRLLAAAQGLGLPTASPA